MAPPSPPGPPPDPHAVARRDCAFSRRAFLRTATGLVALAAWPRGTLGSAPPPTGAPATPRYLTDTEFATLEALCDRILPPDVDPGAAELGAARYVERLLTALEGDVPFLFAGGPFSGRNPFSDPSSGKPSSDYPSNDFATPIPPTSIQALYWRAELYGGAAAGLPPHVEAQWGGTLRGLREIYREGLASVDQLARAQRGAAFVELSVAEQDALLPLLEQPGVFPSDPIRGGTFFDLVIRHTLEGCLAAPEYGGNANGAGWRMVGLEGDSQPLGYTLYKKKKRLLERPDHPLSTPNPDEVAGDGSLAPRPLTSDGETIEANISELTALLEQLQPGACS